MSRFLELGKTRLNGDAYRVSFTLALSSGPIIAVTQSALTAAAHEILKNEDLRPVGLMCMAAITVGINAASMYLEAKALREKNYTNSPVTTGANLFFDRPGLVAIGSHIYHMAVLGILNPVNIITFNNLLSGKPMGDLAGENAMAISTTSAAWKIMTNSLIISGKIKPLADVLEKVNNKVIAAVKPAVIRARDTARMYFDG